MKIQYQNQHLTVFESALYRTTCTFIHRKDYTLLIDPNWLPIEVEFIAQKVAQASEGREQFLLFTHSDYDHIIAYERFNLNSKALASKELATHPNPEEVLQQIRSFDEEYYIQRDYEISYPKVDITINDIEKKMLGSDFYHFYPAIGHNRDGILTYNSQLGVLIVGDYLSNIEFPFIYESFTAYQQTLRYVAQILEQEKVNLLITGHGDCTEDPKEMRKRLEDSKNYLERLENAVRNGIEFPVESLWEQYRASAFLKKYHEANLELVKREIG